MNIRDVLYMRNTGKLRPRASIQDKLLARKLGGSGVITTATGNPVSIITNKAQNAISTILSYSPRQSGSGDPSPINIRPIEGWTEANLFGCGKNLFSNIGLIQIDGKILNDNGDEVNATNSAYTEPLTDVKPNTTYILSGDLSEWGSGTAGGYRVYFYDRNGNFISRSANLKTTSGAVISPFTTPSDCVKIAYQYQRVNNYPKFDTIQLEVGTTATTYEPYTQGANNTISLGGTYYGFTVDVERGVLRSDGVLMTLDGTNENWTLSGSGDSRFFRLNLIEGGYVTQEGLCDQFVRTAIRTDNTDVGFNVALSQDYYHLRFRPNGISTMSIDDWKTMLANQPVHVIIYKSEPLEIPITPQTVALLAGANTLWCDGDEVSVTYKAKK